MMAGETPRQYPLLAELKGQRVLPITFLTVRFSGEYEHNILASECVSATPHQLVTVDNRGNLSFENLGRAINYGLSQAKHEIIAIVHEDVLLVRYWDQHLSRCVDELAASGAVWGLLASKGRPSFGFGSNPDDLIGHWSGPDRYRNTLQSDWFAPAGRIDEHLMVVRKSSGLRLDPDLPSIHFIGIDLPLALRERGLSTYVINAPTIHKYADPEGHIIGSGADSAKVQARRRLPFKAGLSLAHDFITRKWPELTEQNPVARTVDRLESALDAPPLIVTGKGGGGTRLASVLAQDLGVFLGNDLNVSGDTLEMALPMYRGILRSLLDSERPHRGRTPFELREAARTMLAKRPDLPQKKLWGMKLPEAMLLLPELLEAFPGMSVLHLVRDPLHTCLRRTHLTARLSNDVGRSTLPAAYRYLGRPRERILSDSPAIHMACTCVHQIEVALSTLDSLPPHRCLHVRFEELAAHPHEAPFASASPYGSFMKGSVNSSKVMMWLAIENPLWRPLRWRNPASAAPQRLGILR